MNVYKIVASESLEDGAFRIFLKCGHEAIATETQFDRPFAHCVLCQEASEAHQATLTKARAFRALSR